MISCPICHNRVLRSEFVMSPREFLYGRTVATSRNSIASVYWGRILWTLIYFSFTHNFSIATFRVVFWQPASLFSLLAIGFYFSEWAVLSALVHSGQCVNWRASEVPIVDKPVPTFEPGIMYWLAMTRYYRMPIFTSFPCFVPRTMKENSAVSLQSSFSPSKITRFPNEPTTSILAL